MSLPDRATLLSILDLYIAERHAGRDAAALLDEGARKTENGAVVDAGGGFWGGVIPTGYRLTFCDPSAGQVGCHATFRENDLVGIYALRLRVNGSNKIEDAEVLVARKGDSNAFAPHRLLVPNEAFEQSVRSIDKRERLIEIANAYFDAVETSDTSATVIAPDCDRIENGLRTTNNPAGGLPWDCREGMKIFGYIDRVRDRRYPLVDEARGLVWSGAVLEVPKDSVLPLVIDGKLVERPQAERSIFLSELFRIVDGQIRAIDVVVRNMPKGAGTGWA